MMQNVSSILGKARRVLYQVKYTDSYKYRKNLARAQVVLRFFISLGDGVCFWTNSPRAGWSLLLFVLVQRLIKNTERNFLNWVVLTSFMCVCVGGGKGEQVQCNLITKNMQPTLLSSRHMQQRMFSLWFELFRRRMELSSPKPPAPRLPSAMWDLLPGTSLLLSCRSSKLH